MLLVDMKILFIFFTLFLISNGEICYPWPENEFVSTLYYDEYFYNSTRVMIIVIKIVKIKRSLLFMNIIIRLRERCPITLRIIVAD